MEMIVTLFSHFFYFFLEIFSISCQQNTLTQIPTRQTKITYHQQIPKNPPTHWPRSPPDKQKSPITNKYPKIHLHIDPDPPQRGQSLDSSPIPPTSKLHFFYLLTPKQPLFSSLWYFLLSKYKLDNSPRLFFFCRCPLLNGKYPSFTKLLLPKTTN